MIDLVTWLLAIESMFLLSQPAIAEVMFHVTDVTMTFNQSKRRAEQPVIPDFIMT